MAQVTIYLDAATAAQMKKAAKAAGVSQSRFLAELIRQRTAREWPAAVRQLAGAWADLEFAEAARRNLGKDARRERL
jgi:hypothetical protein